MKNETKYSSSNIYRRCLQLEQIIHQASRFMAVIAAVLLGAMMLIITADVFCRYFFKTTISGAWEIVGLLLILCGTWGMAYCQRKQGHINVRVILDLLPTRIQNIILSIAYTTGCIGFSIISWRAMLLTQKYLLISRYHTDILHIPFFPFTLAIALSAALTTLVLLVDIIKSINKVICQ